MRWEIFKVEIDQKTKEEIWRKIKKILQDSTFKKPFFIVTLNPEILLKARKNFEYQKIFNSADLKINDGFGLQLLAKLKKKKIGERLTGADLAEMILLEANSLNLKIGLVLNQEGLSFKKELENFLFEKGINNFFVFSQNRDAFLESEKFPENFSQSQILLVGLGAPYQEKFIFQAIKNGYFSDLKLAIGVGGTFDFWTGKQKRAPLFLRKIGLEWLWRLFFQPWRLGRIWKATVVFLIEGLREK